MKIALIPNLTKKNAQYQTERIAQVLRRFETELLMNSADRESFPQLGAAFLGSEEELFQECDAVISVGGDGTIIRAAKHAARFGKAVLGINVGRLGFVAGLEVDELDQLDHLISGNYEVEQRMMLSITLADRESGTQFCALNDAVVSRGSMSRILDFQVSLNETNVCGYRADGLILATPTGSTGYSLSAGGPVIDPVMQCVVLTPICPHSLFTRPVVFSPGSRLTVTAACNYEGEIFLTADGETSLQLHDGERIEVTRSDIPVRLIKLKKMNFYEVVNEKLAERRS